MKSLRIMFSVVVLLLAIVVFAVGSLMIFVDPNKMKPIIAKAVKDKTNYQLAIQGDLTWSFYPRLGVKITRLTLQQPNQSTPFIDLRGVTMATKISQLIYGYQKLQGDIYINDASIMKMRLQDISVRLHWNDGILSLQNINGSLYDGKLSGSAHGSELSVLPHWDWDVRFEDVQVKPLLQDLNGADSKLQVAGVAQLKFQAGTHGKSQDDIIKNLNGVLDFSLKNGVVNGVDLNYLVSSADKLINNGEVALPENINQTNFDSLSGLVVIRDGVANSKNIVLDSSVFMSKGQGDLDLIHQYIDMRLQVMPQSAEQTKWFIPVLIKGSLYQPDVRLDALTLKTLVAKEQIEQVKAKVQEQIKKLPEKADKLLQHILGQ